MKISTLYEPRRGWRARLTGVVLAALLLPALADPIRAGEETIELTNGDKISGEVISRTDEEIVLDHPVLGRVSIPVTAEKGPEQHPGLFGTSFLSGWSRSFDVGVNGSRGNSESASILVGLHMKEKTETRRWRINGVYKLSATGSDRDENNALLESRRDWLLPGSNWFTFSGAGYRYDEFENWEHRISVLAGGGYHVLRDGPLELDFLAGPHLVYEFGDKNELRVEAMLGFEAVWNISESNSLELANYVYPQLNASEYRNLTRLQWRMRIMNSEHLGLALGFDNEYDSASFPERNNLKYWTSLSYLY